ncbi:MAG TPA: PQQ-binding-like beta-propeller repeat protein [Vicinamibacterales bacterium]|nr:PQQ-binding-like beta-propeller repeat protein [Vicinamibacterales bacterium]
MLSRLSISIVPALALVAALSVGLRSAAPDAWPGFRGPTADGRAGDADLPTAWSKTQNVTWSVAVPGRGWSSPIVWRDRIYVTSAIGSKPFKQPSPGLYGNDYIAELRAQGLPPDEINRRVRARDNEIPEESDTIRYMVYAFDLATGKLVWEREAHKGLPSGGRHRKNTYASETPVTDGERLYVSFGQNIGIFAFTLAGDLVWKRTWPPQPIYLDFGTASSPVLHGGRVILLQDSERDSFITAIDARTGADVWRTARPRGRTFPLQSSWSTPFIWRHAGRTEIVTTGHAAIASYDAADGRELWRINNTTMPTPSPFAADGRLFVGTGAQGGDASRPFFAIKPGAAGDISLAADQTSNAHISWMQPRASGYTPSGIIVGGRVYLVHDTGIMGVYDAETGREVYKARVGGIGHTFSASPVSARNRIYFPDEEGVTIVIEAGDSYKEIAQNDLGELTLASPAVVGDALIVRTETRLYRIEK